MRPPSVETKQRSTQQGLFVDRDFKPDASALARPKFFDQYGRDHSKGKGRANFSHIS